MSLLLRSVTVPSVDGTAPEVCDLRIDGERIVDRGQLALTDQDEVIDGSGYLVLPAPAEPHAHLDKALTADEVHNETGDLLGAIQAWITHRETLTVSNIAERATRAVKLGVSNGVTAFRTHVDLGSGIDLTGLQALQQVKADVAHLARVEIVGLIGCPLTGVAGAEHRAIIAEAIAAGLDVVGGVPHLDPDSAACTKILFDLAGEAGLPLDLHTDENLRPDSLDLEILADIVLDSGFDQSVTASHCVALGIQDEITQQRVAAKTATAGISVITLPQTNLFLQARDTPVAPPRGLTALMALRAAGVNVAGGADNLQDPFCTVGRGDPLETASLLVMAGHLTPTDAYDAVSNRARTVLGMSTVGAEVGSVADILMIRAASLREAVATASTNRIVIRAGRIVFRQTELL